jgi:dUTP pyrophosphatase
MASQTVRLRRLSEFARLPRYSHPGDSGLDLCSAEAGSVKRGERRLFRTGLAIELQSSMEGQIRSRSGLASHHGVVVLNSPGTIDSGFRGELCVLLANFGEADFEVEIGMRIAQLVVAPTLRVSFEEVTELSASERGEGGFGSTANTER